MTGNPNGWRVLRRAVVRRRRHLTVGSLLICAHQACEAAVPIMIGLIVDRAIDGGRWSLLVAYVFALAGLFVLLTTVYRLGARQLMRAIADEGHQLRVDVAAHALHPRGLRESQRPGDLLTITTSDADNTSYLLDYIPRIAGAITATAICAGTLFVIDVRLGLIVTIATPAVLVGLQVTAPTITRRVADKQEFAGRAASLATDLVTGLRPLRGVNAQGVATRRFESVCRAALSATLRAARTQATYAGAASAVSGLLAVGIAVAAGWSALTGRITIGELITVIGLAQFLLEPFSLLAIVPSWVAEARASADRISAIEATEPNLPAGTVEDVGLPASMTLDAINYETLTEISLDFPPGEFVGVVATDPGDAEALIRLLSGRVSPEDFTGSVSLGSVELGDLARASRFVVAAPHHADLFSGSLYENVAVDVDGDVQPALAAAAVSDVIATYRDGLAHRVVERGATLSGGQRQRLALARALYSDPPVLVLHDPTSAVDAVTEHAVAQGIAALRRDRITVVVTSSPALLAVTDRVHLLVGGAITASGTHGSLCESHSDYRSAVLR